MHIYIYKYTHCLSPIVYVGLNGTVRYGTVEYVQYLKYAQHVCADRTVQYIYRLYGMYVRRYVHVRMYLVLRTKYTKHTQFIEFFVIF